MTAPDNTLHHYPLSGQHEQWATRAIFLMAGVAMAALAPLVPFAKARVGVEDGVLGLLLLCLGLGSIVAMPITGVLASRLGCRAVIAASSSVVAIVLPFLAVVDTAWGLALALAIFGASVGTVDVAMNIQAVMVEKDSGRNMMPGFHGLFSLGGIVGAGGVSLLLGIGVTPLAATLTISGLVLVLLIGSYSGLLPYGNRETGGAPLLAFPKGIVIFIGLLCFIVFLGEGSVLDWSAIFLVETHGIDATQAGFGYTMFAMAMTIGRLAGDRIVRVLGSMIVVIGGGLVAAAGFILAVLAPSEPLALVGFLLVGLGASNIVPVLFTAAGRQTRMPASLAIAAVTTLGYAGMLVGPAAVGFIAQHWNLSAAFVFIATGMAFVALSWPVAMRR